MSNFFTNYIQSVSSKFSHKETSEMGYRSDFEILLKEIFKSINVKRIDHDARAKKGNKPDFVLLKNDVPILYIEAKDIGVSLDKIEKSEQMVRYFGYSNLILTDYLEFRFYRNGLSHDYGEPIKIAEYNLKERTLKAIPENYDLLTKTLLDFAQSHKEPIKSGAHLAKIMGGKAQRIRDNLKSFFNIDSEQSEELKRVYEAIRKMLVHDLSLEAFADMYAQTLVYGLFVARYYDDSPDTFSRQEARDLIPVSNPFLQHFFDHIAGPNFDKRLSYIVDELCEVFQHANTKKLVEEYMEDADPIIHFYEDFLNEYDLDLRKRMGAYYTPLPIVNFIVHSVDHVLRKDFGFAQGLADTAKLANGKHKVQILDPSVGTGTFISATIRVIYERLLKQKQEGRWPAYVHNDLLPRLHGFELMMAPYTIAHLKLSLAFKQTGFWKFHRRLGIYLTNSLEQPESQKDLLSFGLADSIAKEAKEATIIKNETPIMVVIGNPPYSAVSSNKNAKFWADKYKFEPGGKVKLKERKNWLDDDYVKFISFAENLIDKNREGILAYITNNGFIDNVTFRGMRWHLLKTFNEIYIFNLHGNSKKKEKTPKGEKDENVFNIQQGVSINIFIKKIGKNNNCKIYNFDLYGKRLDKFDFLEKHNIDDIKWIEIEPKLPNLFFVDKGNGKDEEEYNQGFSIGELFKKNSCGIVTMGDNFIIDTDKKKLVNKIRTFLNEKISASDLKAKYDLGKNYANWVVENKSKIIIDDNQIISLSYRPFDDRFIIFNKNLIWRTRDNVMGDVLNDKYALVFEKNAASKDQPVGIFVSKNIIDCHLTGGQSYVGALYSIDNHNVKISNLDKKIIDKIETIIGNSAPEDIFDYIYAFLHSPTYREKYKEFLKINFPRVSYPKNKNQFFALATLGHELREIHLLESPKVNQFITTYPVSGSNVIERVSYKDGKVFINSEQYFGNILETVWNFYIGNYQPIQKWLKNRKGYTLSNSDIEHYQKIIVAIAETERIMKEIDKNL